MRAAAVAASAVVVSSLATGCGPQRVEPREPEPPPAEIQQTPPEKTQEQPGEDMETSVPAAPSPGLSFLDSQCTCVSEQKNPDGTPVSTSPCMCVSHMMCTATTGMWLCPEGHTQQLAPPTVPEDDTGP